MTEALEVARVAGSRGTDVRAARDCLHRARDAFAAKDYRTAMEQANLAIRLCGPVPETQLAALRQRTASEQIAEAKMYVKQARKRGFDVRRADEGLKRAETALRGGDYHAATRLASFAIERSGSMPARLAVQEERRTVLARMTEALEAAKQARDRGQDVRSPREVLRKMKKAFGAEDYRAAMELADRVIALCSSSAPPIR
jgi:hypothetical protein